VPAAPVLVILSFGGGVDVDATPHVVSDLDT